MKVSEFMRVDVVTAGPDMNVADVASQMIRSQVSGMPVVDGSNKIVGVVTEGDLLRRAESGTEHHRPRWLQIFIGSAGLADEYIKSHALKVKDVMTSDVVAINSDESLDTAVDLMEKRRIKRLPVTKDGKLIGILSRADVLAAFVYKARVAKPSAAKDGDIRAAILDAFEKENWLRGDRLSVVVRNGAVELYGTVISESERKALVVMAERTNGVKAVSDKLTYVDPIALTPVM